MSEETFAGALRAELDAVVVRYEAMVRAHREAMAAAVGRDAEALRAEVTRLSAENERLRADDVERRAREATLEARATRLESDLSAAQARIKVLERETEAALESTLAYEEQFAPERRFVDAGRSLTGSLLGEALNSALGRELEPNSATYAALKGRGLEATLVAAVKERGRSSGQAPLLERERAALALIAAAAGCELIAPAAGTRFSAASMERAGTVSEPAEEGNVVSCAMPGCRRSGTEGALVFPRVIVASG
jgi:hypothetical protein